MNVEQIVVDMPPEHNGELCDPAQAAGLDFIRLTTPTTDDVRLPTVLAGSSGFVYYVSVAGVTGAGSATTEMVKRALQPQRLVNGYGPTETVVTPLLWRAEATECCDAAYAPIGRRVAGRGMYVLDADMNPLPAGVSGELYLGGECLARGYHQQPGLSAERFVPDPFDGTGGRMYRTGDRVRQRADGVIDYLGRLDQQVKIRGFRIELGEIEACLRQCEGVQDAAVNVIEGATGKQLVGYVVAPAGAALERELKAHVQAHLPDYMVPAHIVQLARLPLSANGKLDRRALPEPQLAQGHYRAPRNALERALAEIWQDVLGLERVGIDDNFFELGGDSLQVLKVISRVRNQPELGVSLKLRDLMQKPCIAELSGYEPLVAASAPDPLLALNSRVSEVPPLFCLHAGFGTVFDYEPLARKLDGRRSVYGVQCRMLLDPAWHDDSLHAMAQAYAECIRQQQAHGPYHLLGWSLGGALTLLVAQALEAQGQEVAFAGLVDSYVAGTAEASDEREDVQDFLRFVLGVSEVMLIGGAQLYTQGLADADRLYLTRVGLSPEGDAWFPEFDQAQWKLVYNCAPPISITSLTPCSCAHSSARSTAASRDANTSAPSSCKSA